MLATLPRLAATASVDDVVGELREHGTVVLEDVLDADEVAMVSDALEPLFAATPLGRNDFEGFSTRRIFSLLAKTRATDRLVLHPLVTGAADTLLGHNQLSATVAIGIEPGETAQGLHTDDLLYPIPRPHDDLMLSTMWAIDDFVAENGATLLIPGSHRWGDELPSADHATVPAEMRAGSVVLYLGTTWHAGGTNTTDRIRRGITFEYIASWLRPQENHLVAVPPSVAAELPPEIAELLGYNVRPPFVGYVDGRHPRKYLGG